MKIKVAIVGLGRIFTKHLAAIQSNKNIEIIAICDTSIKKKSEYSYLNVFFYRSMEKMLSENKVDLTIICTPSGYHADHFAKLSSYCKNFVIEKPIALTKSEIKKILFYKKKNKNNIFVVKQNRFNKPVILLNKLLKENAFGELFYCDLSVKWKRTKEYYALSAWRGTYKLDGGIIGNQGAHQLDLLISMFGFPKKINVISRSINKKIEYPDMLLINFQYNNNLVVNYHITTATRPFNYEGSILVMGKRGTMKIGGYQLNKIEYLKLNDFKKQKKIDIKNYTEKIKNVYGNGHKKFYNYIYLFLRKNIEDYKALQDAISTTLLINDINKFTKRNDKK
jgi:UDP-N-acetyl-2-amino-2-deoxyglucuronate dehydrogenase